MSTFFKMINFGMSKRSLSSYIMLYQHDTVFEVYSSLFIQIWDFLWHLAKYSFQATDMYANHKGHIYHLSKMNNAKSFEEWDHAATELDRIEGSTAWIQDPDSNDYDWKLLQKRIDEINHVRAFDRDRKSMIFTLKLSLSRNLGDMGNATLYRKTRVGTKQLISDYTDTVIEQLNWIGGDMDPNEHFGEDLTLKEKHDYFMTLRQGYGRTALLLSGGGTLGFFHIGVLKAMINARLLPRIISGASTGSIMASLICTLNEQDRIKMLNSPWSIALKVFEHPEFPESPLLRLNRYLLEGNLYDPNILKSVLADHLGDITFQEAYNKSRLILNITVSSSSLFEMPRLFNYITSPDVVVWSAALASCSVPLFYPSQEIYMKNKTGQLVPWTSTVDKYRDGSIDNDLPLKRISELFSVNHFVVVQCKLNPHVAPFIHKDHSEPSLLRTGINFFLRFIKEEIQHRCSQLKELGISPNGIMRLQNVLSQIYIGDITIAPQLSFKDVVNILSNPDFESATGFIERGERATWQKMSKIKHSLKIELAIDAAIYKLRSKLLGESPQWPNTSQIEEVPVTTTTTTEDMPCTPLWQMDSYESLCMYKNNGEKPRRPSLLPHTFSRSGPGSSHSSSHNNSQQTSLKRRRKQVTSTQFFISPDFEWHPNTTFGEFGKSVRSSSNNKKRLSIVIPK
ncbi:acyl transferase/acyl hydrolase/lysophospholipase [Mucor mucedo]|uniref:acyl transferase/acyl hydrolase/lysophospholipase n=1 Tax=Mucor mucedo TaxID=29922 RepID=UPI00221FF61A|nr:acyl transferase/acyl hydrolase/lysophospholipase [Mucor mucedo]KAI7891122.1 acyl transferase/acyl hydrolase/lysophospholipase [Mucor mucedo]